MRLFRIVCTVVASVIALSIGPVSAQPAFPS